MPVAKWREVLDSITRNAIQSYVNASRGREIVDALLTRRNEGVSFSELRRLTKMNSASLKYQLDVLSKGGLVENFLSRRDNSRDYSFYRPTPLGEIVASEFDVFSQALQRQVVTSSANPAVMETLGSSIWTPAGEIFEGIVDLNAFRDWFSVWFSRSRPTRSHERRVSTSFSLWPNRPRLTETWIAGEHETRGTDPALELKFVQG